MPRAIQAIRSYPITLLLAGLLFLCSLALATASIGKIIGGGEDEGSGMGGTGKSGDFGGSGFGGTGGPIPFFSVTDDVPESEGAPVADDSVLPALIRSIDNILETAEVPRPSDPREELPALRPPVVTDDEYIGLEPMTPVQQLRQELAEAAGQDVADTVIRVEIEVADPTPRRALAEQIDPFEMPGRSRAGAAEEAPVAGESTTSDEPALMLELAGQSDEEPSVTAETAAETQENGEHRVSPERIQRPELPPFQRMRPVQGASMPAPRPVPMRI